MRACGTCGYVGGARLCERCGADRARQPDLVVIDGRYALLAEIGRGGMGVVHRARDVTAGRDVALKIVDVTDVGMIAAAEALGTEAAALAAIQSSHVVGCYAYGRDPERSFLVMEHVDGVTLEAILEQHIARDGHVAVPRVITLVRQIAEGLGAVHRAGLVHRDVKPANIVVEKRTGRPVLVDFGLAWQSRFDARADGSTFAGTPEYMAPEQLAGAAPTPQSDLYALACTMYETLTGYLPFRGETLAKLTRAHANAVPTQPSILRAGLGPFDAVILRALAKDPASRFANAEAFVAALDAADFEWRRLSKRSTDRFSPAMLSASSAAALSVLVVDDDELSRKIAARCVKLAFFRSPVLIKAVSSGQEALAVFAERPARLVLLDYSMPGLDGLDTLTELRGLPNGTDALVVVISGNIGAPDADTTGQLERWRFEVLGVEDFVQKPIDLAAFVELLTTIARDTGLAIEGEVVPRVSVQGRAVADASVLDARIIAELRTLEARTGDGLLAELVADLLTFAPEAIEGAVAAVGRGHLPAAQLIAHRLKGGAGALGLTALSAAARALEVACHALDPARARSASTLLQAEWMRALEALGTLGR